MHTGRTFTLCAVQGKRCVFCIGDSSTILYVATTRESSRGKGAAEVSELLTLMNSSVYHAKRDFKDIGPCNQDNIYMR